MTGYSSPSPFISHVFDVAITVDDLKAFYELRYPDPGSK